MPLLLSALSQHPNLDCRCCCAFRDESKWLVFSRVPTSPPSTISCVTPLFLLYRHPHHRSVFQSLEERRQYGASESQQMMAEQPISSVAAGRVECSKRQHTSCGAEEADADGGDEYNRLYLFSEQLEWPQSAVARRMVAPSSRSDTSVPSKSTLPAEWGWNLAGRVGDERRGEPVGSSARDRHGGGGGGTLPRVYSAPVPPFELLRSAVSQSREVEMNITSHDRLQRLQTAEDRRGDAQWSDGPAAAVEAPSLAALGTTRATHPASRSTVPPLRSVMRAFVSDNPWDTLHTQPALAVVGSTTALSMISAYVLQHHVLDTKDHIGVFLFGSYLVFASYFMVYYFLERFSVSFRKISQDKKFYTISNLIKAGVLVSITPFAVWNLFRIVVHDEWESNTLRNLGCIYAIPDFVSMVAVRRMAWTTWLHHICVCVFNYFSIYNDYSQENVCRLIVVYAAFSTFAYCVNMLLASRFLGVSAQVSRVLSFVALCVYVLCCAVNWIWQAHYLNRLIQSNDHWTIYLYMTLICFVMWDDIVLNRWLLQNARNNHGLLMKGTRSVRGHESLSDGSGVSHDQTLPAQPRRGWRGACS